MREFIAASLLVLAPAAVAGGTSAPDLPPVMPEEVRVGLDGERLLSVRNEMAVSNGDPRVVKLEKPNLRLFPCAAGKARGTVLLFPGGGYRILAVTKEGAAVAAMLNGAGYDVAMLEYTIGDGDARAMAIRDALAAVALLRKQGAEMGLHTERFGVMGFSAGGHLAARLMHELGAENAPDFGILIYPAYLEKGKGLDPDVAPPSGARTSLFTLISDNDNPGWVAGARAYVNVCRANGQRSEFHLLKGGGHGFGITAGQNPPVSDWPLRLKTFLSSEPSPEPRKP